jgi:transposase, IS30 family
MKKHHKITSQERDKIACLLATGKSLRMIAIQLNRAYSSIREEVKRNSIGSKYQAIKAQALSLKRNSNSRKLNPLKSPEIYSYVVDKLRCGWTPEQIAGRLKRKHRKTVICHETIYRYIYSEAGRHKNLNEYLPRAHKKRRKWFGRKNYRKGIQNRVSIHDRPEVIETLTEFGHWEIDSVEGKAHKGGIHTFLERKTRFYQAGLMDNIDSEEGARIQLKIFEELPKKARKTATFDNGKENYNHTKLRSILGMKTYFCDPNAAWQKGSNENHNGVLRRYIPKKTDLTTIHPVVLDAIVEEINNRPRKCLGYRTPNEAFKEELKSIK